MPVDIDKFFQGFCDESHEHRAFIEQALLDLDPDSPDLEEINGVFRAAHSIKGGSGVFNLDALTAVTHLMENLLDKARNSEIALTHDIVSVLLETNDVLGHMLDSYQNKEAIDDNEVSDISDKLGQCLKDAEAAAGIVPDTVATDAVATDPVASPVNKDEQTQSSPDAQQAGGDALETDPSLAFGFDVPPNDEQGTGTEVEAADDAEAADAFGFFDEPEAPEAAAPAAVEQDEPFGFFPPEEPPKPEIKPYGFFDGKNKRPNVTSLGGKKTEKSTSGAREKSTSVRESSSIRVDTQKIDALVNLVGELVITQSILQVIGAEVTGHVKTKLQSAITDLKRNTREIQDSAMSMRMLPIGMTFDRFPRVVRDLSNQLGKKLDLVIEGGGTEIDKGMIEKLVDPLTHLVRNSIDHGIESKEKRLEAGKSETGQITLRAEQRGSCIVISVIDDGAGLNRDRILAKAEENGVPWSDDMTDEQVWSLIFAPGFSTAAEVTNVSGRGVGMDVVRRNIESIGGTIEIDSNPGKGCAINIQLPLTLAILDGMCVQVGNQVFVIPLSNIVESLQPTPEQLKDISNDKVLWIRDEYWPLVELGDYMQVGDNPMSPEEGVVVLVQSNKKRFGIVVNALLGQQQVVIKSLEKHFKKVIGVAGATIMGDGSVALILDIESLAESNALNMQEEALCG